MKKKEIQVLRMNFLVSKCFIQNLCFSKILLLFFYSELLLKYHEESEITLNVTAYKIY